MDDIILPEPVDEATELARLTARYKAAGGTGLQILAALGGQAENLIDRLPPPVRDNLSLATERALTLAMQAADGTRGAVPRQQPEWVHTGLITAMGAAGGFGGLPGALAELPVTTTALLRAIQDVAVETGFDPRAEDVKFDCVRVFASAGPADQDDGADTAFLSLRLTLTGAAMQKLIAMVAPRLAAVLGQKLAAQSVPVLGAMAGATTNYLYTRYYREMAHVHFGIRRLAIDSGTPEAELLNRLISNVSK